MMRGKVSSGGRNDGGAGWVRRGVAMGEGKLCRQVYQGNKRV